MVSLTEQESKTRLIVLIPQDQVDNTDLVNKVATMAKSRNLDVLYFVIAESAEGLATYMHGISNNTATSKLMPSANEPKVEVKFNDSRNWLADLESIFRPEDRLVCLEGQVLIDASFKAILANNFLTTHMNRPVDTISGMSDPISTQKKKRFHELYFTLGFLAIMILFTWLQIRIDEVLSGFQSSILVLGTFCMELGAIWGWYSLMLH